MTRTWPGIAQEFAVRFLRGDFRRADPGRGRFRDYLKTALIHLVTDYRRAQRTAPPAVAAGTAAPEPADDDDVFLASWQAELLDRTGTFRCRPSDASTRSCCSGEEPDLPSPVIAERPAVQLGRPTAVAVRKASPANPRRRYFAELLVAEVARSLDEATPIEIEAELRELDLFRYCRSALPGTEPTG